MPAVESDLLDVIAKEALVDRAALVRDAKLEDLGISSIDLISVVFEIEEKYGVVLESQDIPNVATLGEMSDFLLSRINAVEA
jgi:acyl carrier protein